MSESNEFLQRIGNIVDPEVEKGIKSGNSYVICDLLEQTTGGVNGVYLRKLEDAIIATNDIVQIYEFMFLAVDMNIAGFDRERFERIIRESGNSKLMCYCMEFVPGTNIEKMLVALENVQNAKDMERIIKDEEYSDVYEKVKQIDPQYEEKVEKAKEVDYFPESLKQFMDFKEDIPSLKEEVIKTKNPHLITELANYIEYLNECKEQDYDVTDLAVAQQETKDPMQAYEFLASVQAVRPENKIGLIRSVVNSERTKFMYYVYAYVPDLTEQEEAYLKSGIQITDTDGKYRKRIEEELQSEREAIYKGIE